MWLSAEVHKRMMVGVQREVAAVDEMAKAGKGEHNG